jgi:succinate dehydrogenase hydrophobic anchor subunit
MTPSPTRERSVAVDGETSFWRWLVLVATGLLLLVFVVSHIWSVHYSGYAANGTFTFDAVSAKLRHPLSRWIDLSLLVLALVHGLVGTQRIVADLGVLGQKALRLVNVALTGIGVLGLFYGWAIYRAFVR